MLISCCSSSIANSSIKAKMSKYFAIFVFVSILPQSILSVNLEKLLHDKISDAKCFAQCQEAANEDDRSQCFVICKILQENPQTNLCGMSEVCLGGCKIACDDRNKFAMETKFLNVVLEECQLSWEVEGDSKNVAFLVAGKDQGNMWNLIFNKLSINEVYLTPQMGAKFVKIQVFVINGKKFDDKISLDLSQNICFEEVPNPREISILTKEEEAISLTAIIFLSTVGTCSLLFIAAIIYFRTRSTAFREPKPAYKVEVELSYAITDVTFPASDVESHASFLTQENFIRPNICETFDRSSSSNDYEEIQVEELEYIDPFVC